MILASAVVAVVVIQAVIPMVEPVAARAVVALLQAHDLALHAMNGTTRLHPAVDRFAARVQKLYYTS